MKKCSKIAMIMAIFAVLGVLVQIAPASAAVTVTLTVPDVVAPGATFDVTVKVENDSETDTIIFNKVAAVYVLPDVKYKGPYQVDTQTRQVGPKASTTFSFPFAIRYTQGCIVPLAVVLFKDSYTYSTTNPVGLNGIGVNVSK